MLIVASSGRALAESALRGGWAPRVIDAFADRDTREAAPHSVAVPFAGGRLDPDAVLRAARRMCPPAAEGQHACALVYGSGLEAVSELVASLAEGRVLLGNPVHVLRTVNEPRRFFALLDALAIPHPEVSFAPRVMGPGWLLKQAGASGGGHVCPALPGQWRPAGAYLQRQTAGQPMSLLFLADGRRATEVGFNTLWTASEMASEMAPEMIAGMGDSPYLYGGLVNRAVLPPSLRQSMCAAAGALTRALGLRGLNGIDFIHDGERCRVLELNPRPSASFELYEPEARRGLFALHVAACQGRLPALPRRSGTPARAVAIVYAPRELRIPEGFVWPRWCRDRPQTAQCIARGEPLCSVYAEAQDARAAQSRVFARRTALLDSLTGYRQIA